jgi:pilus assembly protein CpaB
MGNAGRLIAVVAAVVLAVVATGAIAVYVRGIEQRAFEDAELVEVFVAQQDIPQGVTSANASEAGLIGRENLPRAAVPEGALTSLEQVDGLVTVERILAGEVLVIGRWGTTTDARIRAIEVPEGFEAVSVQVGIPPGVAGFIREGDRISLLATLETPDAAPGPAPDEEDAAAEQDATELRTQYLLQGIQVLSVGQRITTAEGTEGVEEPGGTVLLTLALEAEDVERLVFAIETASLYFTLLPEDAEPADTPGRDLATLFDE